MTIQNPHHATGVQKLNTFKEIITSLDGWKFVSDKDGVKTHTMTDSTGFDLIRGDYLLKGTQYTAKQVANIPNTFGTKTVWDSKNDMAEMKAWYNESEALFWSRIKTPWPVTNRDMVTAAIKDFVSDDETYTVVYSVEDDSAPVTSTYVRAHIFQAAWRFLKTSEGISITYVTQFDLSGSIPAAFQKTVSLENPTHTARIAKYVKDFGFPPYAQNYSESLVQKSDNFDHGKKKYTVQLAGTGDVNIFTSKTMYPSGIKVKVSGKASHQVKDHQVIITGVNGSATVEISKA